MTVSIVNKVAGTTQGVDTTDSPTFANPVVTNLIEGYQTIATAAGTTTLTVTSPYQTFFTGSTTQTVLMPVVSTLALGMAYFIENNSTGAVTVQSSGANTIVVLAGGTSAVLTCISLSGTDATSWDAKYAGSNVTSAKKLSVSNSLTLAGTDGTTMTFPSTSATIARTDAGNTFTGTQTMGTVSAADVTSAAATQGGIANPTTGIVTVTDTAAAAQGVGGQVVFRGNYTGTTPTQYGAITAYKESATVDGSQYGAALVFNTRTQGGNNTEKFRLASDGTATFKGPVVFATGTATVVPAQMVAGTNLTSAVAGGIEYDGVNFYLTPDTTGGRGCVPAEQYFHLTANGSTISTIANFFGTTSNISLVANAYYEIDIEMFFLNTTSGTVTWSLINSAAPSSQNIYYEMSPVTGVVAPPGTATELVGMIVNDATASLTVCTTGTLTTAVNHYCKMRILLKNGSGTSLKIQATKNVGGTITPLLGSNWHARRMSPNNIGTFSA